MTCIKVLLSLLPGLLAMSQENLMSADLLLTATSDLLNAESLVEDPREARSPSPLVPPVITKADPGVPAVPHPSHPNPEYIPPQPKPVAIEEKCRIEEVQLKAKLCTPSVSKECKTTKLKTKGLVDKEKCFKIVKTLCVEEEVEEDNEVCYYEYNMEDQDTEAKTAEVEYELRCESTSQNYCPNQSGYGNSYCKNVKTKVCYNEPKVSDVRKPVTIGYPVANKICENNPVKVPKVECEDIETEECILLPYVEEDTVEVETCRAEVGKPECVEHVLTLPQQICENIHYSPLPAPAPGYHAPAPAYHAPAPAYHAPAPAHHAPAPAYHAPVSTFHAG